MRSDRVLRWAARALLAATVVFVLVAACGPTDGDLPPDGATQIEVGISTEGPGSVQQPSSGFVCRGDCTWTGASADARGFVAVPDGANAFVESSGACETLDATWDRTLGDGDAITATFAPHALRLHLIGDGEGEFRIQGAGIDVGCTCGCAVGLPQPLFLAITYFAQGSTETVLDAWGGACAGADRLDYCLASVSGATDVSKTWRRPPVAFDDAFATTRNTPLSVGASDGVLANDVDTPGDALTAERVTDVAHGTLALAADGGFRYTPAAGYVGSDGFTYRARDAFGNASGVAAVTLTITNTPPVAVDDVYVAGRNGTLSVPAPGVLANDVDPDGDALTIVDPTPVSDGTLELEPDGGFTYTPPTDFLGVATFTYRVSDGLATSEPATVTIAVVLDTPVAADDAYGTFRNQHLSVEAENGILSNDIDPEGAPLVAILVDDVRHGALDLDTDGGFTYTPDLDFVGLDVFTYVASNGVASSGIANVSIIVANRRPTAVDAAYATDVDSLLVVPAPGVLTGVSDPDDDPLTAVLVTEPGHGTVDLAEDGGFTYDPDPGFVGMDTFTYAASDGLATSNTATVTITVVHVNRAPIADDDAYATDWVTPLVVAAPGVLGNDADPDSDPLTAALVTDVTTGSLMLDADGGFSYSPEDGVAAEVTFTYVANDGELDSAPATATITVTAPETPTPP